MILKYYLIKSGDHLKKKKKTEVEEEEKEKTI